MPGRALKVLLRFFKTSGCSYFAMCSWSREGSIRAKDLPFPVLASLAAFSAFLGLLSVCNTSL